MRVMALIMLIMCAQALPLVEISAESIDILGYSTDSMLLGIHTRGMTGQDESWIALSPVDGKYMRYESVDPLLTDEYADKHKTKKEIIQDFIDLHLDGGSDLISGEEKRKISVSDDSYVRLNEEKSGYALRLDYFSGTKQIKGLYDYDTGFDKDQFNNCPFFTLEGGKLSPDRRFLALVLAIDSEPAEKNKNILIIIDTKDWETRW